MVRCYGLCIGLGAEEGNVKVTQTISVRPMGTITAVTPASKGRYLIARVGGTGK